MAALGMICEWNPFHLGHAWLLRELKRCYSLPVVCVMSGNFVQRGEPAVAEKRARAEMALRCGGGRGVRAADGLGHGVGGALCARRGLRCCGGRAL